MISERRSFVAMLVAVATLVGAPAYAQAPPGLTLMAASSLKNAMDEVNAAFSKSSGTAVTASYAASSALARQIEQGAQGDVFISADVDWMTYVADRKLIRPATRVDLLTNRLALVAPKDSKLQMRIGSNMPIATALGTGRLAMAAADVPAGRYGKAALTSLGVWDGVQAKAAYGENVRAALAFVARGEAPLGIVYDTDAMVEPMVRIVGLFPETSHPRIVYPAAALATATRPEVGTYLTFLRGPQAAAIFQKYGFKTMGRP